MKNEEMTPEQWAAWRAKNGGLGYVNKDERLALRTTFSASEYQAMQKAGPTGEASLLPAKTAGVGAVKVRVRSRDLEHEMQVLIVEDFRLDWPEFGPLLHCIPNGAKLPYTRKKLKSGKTITISPERARLIDEGLQTGMPDLHLPIARGGWKSLYMELKILPNSLSESQVKMMTLLFQEGHLCLVCYTREMAQLAFRHYMNLPAL